MGKELWSQSRIAMFRSHLDFYPNLNKSTSTFPFSLLAYDLFLLLIFYDIKPPYNFFHLLSLLNSELYFKYFSDDNMISCYC